MKNPREKLSVVVALLFGAVLCYFAFRDVPLGELAVAAAGFRLGWLPLILVLPVLDLVVRGARWALLLRPVARAGVWKCFQLEAVGMAVNNILFLRVGELARGVVAGREFGAPTIAVLSSIVVERMCDMVALLTLFAAGSFAAPGLVDWRVRVWALAAAAGLMGALAAITLFGEAILRWPALRGLERHPRLWRLASDLVAGTRALGSWRSAGLVAAYSYLLWLIDAGSFLVMAYALGFEPPMTMPQALITLASAAAGTALPALPGAFGNFEAAVKLLLVHFGYPKALALSYATLIHLAGYVIMTSLGLLFFYSLGHTLSSFRKGHNGK